VKKSYLPAALAALMLVVSFAAEPAAAQVPGQTVAIVDLTYIFQHHGRHKALMEELGRDLKAAEAAVKTKRDALHQMAQKLEEFRVGSPEFKNLEEDITRQQADLNAQISLQRKSFLEREATVLYDTYQSVLEHVRYYSETKGISLVMRFTGDPIDPNNPEEIVRGVNRPLVYFHPNIDITPIILDMANSTVPGRPAAQGAVGSRPQQVPPR